MISRLTPANRIATDFIVADIENRSNGDVLAIGTYDGCHHSTHESWWAWFTWICNNAAHDKAYRTIYAHNGGGWDWLSFIEWVISHNPDQQFHTIENGSRIIAVIVPISDRLTIRLLDSLYLTGAPPLSLDAWATKFIGRGKIKLDHLPEWYWENDKPKFWEYLKEDTVTLYDTIVAFCKMIYTKVAPIPKIGFTLPSTALKCFQTSFLEREVSIPSNDGLKTMLRRGYTGGRVEVFKPGHYKEIYVYDFNSLYPSIMANTPVPATGNASFTRRFRSDMCGVYRIRYTQGNRNLFPVLLHDGVGSYSGEGVFFSPEIQTLIEKAEGKVKILEGYVFNKQAVLFKSYVEKLYALRMTDKDGPLGHICKTLMNALYGKFGQQPQRRKTYKATTQDIKEQIVAGNKVDILNPEVGLYRVTQETAVPFEHVGIAGTITSTARIKLWESFNEGTVYCDTDSIHTTIPIRETGKSLGWLKKEFQGEAVYCGKKLYSYRNEEGEKVRAKGVKVGGKMGFKLDFDTMLSILEGATVQTQFQSGVTANTVLRGGKSCVFATKKRKLRRTANGRAIGIGQ